MCRVATGGPDNLSTIVIRTFSLAVAGVRMTLLYGDNDSGGTI